MFDKTFIFFGRICLRIMCSWSFCFSCWDGSSVLVVASVLLSESLHGLSNSVRTSWLRRYFIVIGDSFNLRLSYCNDSKYEEFELNCVRVLLLRWWLFCGAQIKSDVETQGDFIRFLIKEVKDSAFTDIEDVVAFIKWLDDELSFLVGNLLIVLYTFS